MPLFSENVQPVLIVAAIAAAYLAILRLVDLNEREPLWSLALLLWAGATAAAIVHLLVRSPVLVLDPVRAAVIEESATLVAFAGGAAVLFAVANLMIYFGHKSLPVMMGVFAVAAVATAFAYTGYPKIVIESVPEQVTSVTTGVLSTARQAFSAVGVAIVSVMLSLWTVPGTTAPALSSFDLAVGWFIACSLVVALAWSLTVP